jgi:hypothetical protein
MYLSPQSLSPEERRLYSQLHQMLMQAGVLRGSLVLMRRRCGKAGCRCNRSSRDRHRSLVLKIGKNGQQRTIYVSRPWEDRVRAWVAHYVEIRDVLERLCRACLRRVERGEG